MDRLSDDAVMMARTPPRRKFGNSISSNTPPRSVIKDVKMQTVVASVVTARDAAAPHHQQPSTTVQTPIDQTLLNRVNRRINNSDQDAANHYIDTLPGSFHVSSLLSSDATAARSGDLTITTVLSPANDHRTEQPESRTPGSPNSTGNKVSSDMLLSPSVVRQMASSRSDASSASPTPTPRYSVMLQVLKSITTGTQNYASHSVRTKVVEKIAAALGMPDYHKDLSTALVHKTQALLELNTASNNLRPSAYYSERKSSQRNAAMTVRERCGPFTAVKGLQCDDDGVKGLPCDNNGGTFLQQRPNSTLPIVTLTSVHTNITQDQPNHLEDLAVSPGTVDEQRQQSTDSLKALVTADQTIRLLTSCDHDPPGGTDVSVASTSVKEAQLIEMLESSRLELTEARQIHMSAEEEMARQLEQANGKVIADASMYADKIEAANKIIAKQLNRIGSLERESEQKHDVEFNVGKERHTLLTTSIAYEAQLLEAKNEITELQNQLRAAVIADRNRTRDTDSLRNENDELESHVSRLKLALENKEDQLSAKTTEIICYRSSLEDAKAELFQKKQELHFAARSNEKLQSKLSHLATKLAAQSKRSQEEKNLLTTELSQLREEVDTLENRRTDLDKINRSLRRSLDECDTRMADVHNQLARERESSKTAQQKFQALQIDLNAQIFNAHTQLSATKDEGEELKANRKEMQTHIALLEAHVKAQTDENTDLKFRLETAMSNSRSETELLRSRIEDELKNGTALSQKLLRANQELARFKEEMDLVMHNSKEKIKLLISEMKSQSDKNAEIVAVKDEEISGLTKICCSHEDDRSNSLRLQKSLAEVESQVATLESNLTETKRTHAQELDVLMGSRKKEVKQLHNELNAMAISLKVSNEERDAAKKRYTTFEANLIISQQNRERLHTENDELRVELHAAKDRVQELECQLDALDVDKSSSDESSDGELGLLSRGALKSRCADLISDMHRLKGDIAARSDQCSRLEKRLVCSADDVRLLSEELNEQVKANGQLENIISDFRSKMGAETQRESALQEKLLALNDAKQDMALELEQRSATILALQQAAQDLEHQIKELRCTHENTQMIEVLRVEKLTIENADLTVKVKTVSEELDKTRLLLTEASDENLRRKTQLAKVEADLTATANQLEESNMKLKVLRESDTQELSKNTIDSLREECSLLRTQMKALNLELSATRTNQEVREHEWSEKLALQRNALSESDESRKLSDTELSHALQLVATQKGSIHALEQRQVEAEQEFESASSQITKLQAALDQAKKSKKSSEETFAWQLKELDDKLASMETERCRARKDCSELSDEIREARRKVTELTKQNVQLQSRLESTRQTLAKTTTELTRERTNHDESRSNVVSLKADVDDSKSEVQHLTARLQLLESSLTRIKSDNLRIIETNKNTELELQKKLNTVTLESEANSRKIESLSELYHAQREAILSRPPTHQTKTTQCSEGATSGHSIDASRLIQSLDLAKPIRQSQPFTPQQLNQAQYYRTVDCTLTTPPPKCRPRSNVPSTPDIRDALAKVKQLFQEEVLSPIKLRKTDPTKEDASHFMDVIRCLEVQVDGLLFDLKIVNDALRTKSMVLDDLQKLVYHHEQERDELGLQLERRNAMISEYEERLKQEATSKQDLEMQLSDCQRHAEELQTRKIDSGVMVSVDEEEKKLAAGHMIVRILQDRSRRTKASCFTRWACHIAGTKAAEEQSRYAHELTEKLAATQDILSRLKRHRKMKGQMRASGLEVISEDAESP
ncbi:hypothetical protein MPSEU_000889800 [Mayamaea pseudoterrestris]|nr:hypothetical protein MPSEU_000889800 [Mayamaea pseudoterrestris]